jgi:predicted nucleotidyltransferase
MTIYYSDNPQIMLSWFDKDERWLLRFKFLDRYRNISATKVRQAILDDDDDLIWYYLPEYVKTRLKDIEKYLKESK